MAFTNFFDLGAAYDLYFSADAATWEPIADLPSGTVTVVNGVIQCRDLPDNLGQAGVGYIKLVPKDPNYGAAAVRVKVTGVSIPFTDVDNVEMKAGVVDQATPIEYTGYSLTDDGSEITAVDPETRELGTMDASHTSGDPGVYWGHEETEAA